MFVQDSYRLHDMQQACRLIEEIRTGTLITVPHGDDPFPDCSHLPFTVESDGADPDTGKGAVLVGHVDKRNTQWRALENDPSCRVSFLGPQCHVSPSWYGTRPRAPTWLYVAVVVTGRATLVTDEAALRNMVEHMSNLLEPPGSDWHTSQIEPYTERLMRHIVGFNIAVERIDAQIRLGQGNTVDDRKRVLAGLQAGPAQARAVAELIERLAPIGE